MRRFMKKSSRKMSAPWVTAVGIGLGVVGAALAWRRVKRQRALASAPAPEMATAGQTDDLTDDFESPDEEEVVTANAGTQLLGQRFLDEQESPEMSATAVIMAAASELSVGRDVEIDGMVFKADGDEPVVNLFDASETGNHRS